MKKTHRRLIERDGRYNIKKIGMHKADFKDFYYIALKAPWSLFLLGVIAAYLFLNYVFAVAYVLCGPGALSVVEMDLWTAFLFSIQTSSTIGYGHILPLSQAANLIVVIESVVSLLFVAVTTGLAFAKFSRPLARIIFSDAILITKHDSKPVLMFRVGNVRVNHIVDASINVVVLKNETTAEGHFFKKLYDLKLLRKSTPVFAMSWTVMHEINEKSPLYGMTKEDFENCKVDFIISLTGIDDTFAQQIHSKHAYGFQDMMWDEHFEDMIEIAPDGLRKVDFRKFNDLKKRNVG